MPWYINNKQTNVNLRTATKHEKQGQADKGYHSRGHSWHLYGNGVVSCTTFSYWSACWSKVLVLIWYHMYRYVREDCYFWFFIEIFHFFSRYLAYAHTILLAPSALTVSTCYPYALYTHEGGQGARNEFDEITTRIHGSRYDFFFRFQ